MHYTNITMNKKSGQKLLLLTPVFVLVITLFYADFSLNYHKDFAYKFGMETYAESIQKFTGEINALISEQPVTKESSQFYFNVLNAYNRTVGGKYAVISFLLYDNIKIYHSNESNQAYISTLFQDQANTDSVQLAAESHSSGYVDLNYEGIGQSWFYQVMTDGTDEYYLFMSVDKTMMGKKFEANEIVIPICIIALLFLISVEYSIWIKILFNDYRKKD